MNRLYEKSGPPQGQHQEPGRAALVERRGRGAGLCAKDAARGSQHAFISRAERCTRAW
ncbi:hypothetical protein AB5I41_02760 [Sphingomonas sp. MMS24-JH45]